ncbi:hypothetical protein P3X46_008220 [Hevea brasiliensis]|uniref:Transmembrane protein n=1 Tax=Hevea brasiliensis TaxID=3981 RepID=A0ABQ9MKJ3_HEVBR|nr:uncharacterized protein LOC110651936 [Hevea brasiliensis]KAJ9179908.1 hypothetical protein P3X46_008220 [Hevea brasiliensis]
MATSKETWSVRHSPSERKMSERVSAISISLDPKPSPYSFCLKTLSQSFKIFPRNKRIFSFIFALLALPLSFLNFLLSLSSYPIKSQIFHLELLASRAPTRFEARQVWKESREVALSLLHIKLLYLLPIYFLSLIAAITVVVSTESTYNRRPTNLKIIFAAIRSTWTRPLVTSICIYAILLLYTSIPYSLAAMIGSYSPGLRFVIWLIGLGVELYLIAVLGLGLVVSILEARFGLDAIRIGSRLMEGRRICGWVLSGLLTVMTGGIGRRMEGLIMDIEDSADESKWTVAKGWERAGLVGLYGLVIIWGFAVTTVFYCECRKRQNGRVVDEHDHESVDS